MSTQSSPGFDPFSASFIKHAEKTVRDDRGKSHTENVLLPLLTDMFNLLLSDGVTPHLWHKVKITRLHKKGPITSPQSYRLLAINGCFYRLFANVVRDLWTGLLLNTIYQTHNLVSAPQGTPTNPSLFCDTFATAKKKKMKVLTAFLGPPCCLRQYSKRETLETCKKLKLHNI